MMKLMANKNSDTKAIESIIYLMQTDKSVDAPQDAIQWSKNIFRTRVAKPTLVQKVLAVLQINLAPNKAVFGERSASASQARQMLFEAGDNSIDLRISATDNGFNIHGQILGDGFENAEIKLGELVTNTNELSEFKFKAVAKGSYSLTLTGLKNEIVVENFDLN
jgi:hypothetical protein